MNNKIENKDAIRVLISSNLLRAARMIFYIFLNIFIWKNTQDVKIIALFNIFYLVTHLFSFVLFSPIVKKWKNILLNTFSLWGLALVYFSIILLWEKSIDYIYFIGAWIWFFNWIYWINYHVVQFAVTTYANRWNFTWLKKLLFGLSKILVPSIIWFVISFNYLWYGYQTAFWIWMILFIIAIFVWNISLDINIDTKFKFKELVNKSLKNKNIFVSLYTHSFTWFSFWNTILEVIIGVVIFQHVWSEDKLWYLLSALSIVSIIVMWIFWKFVSYKKYSKYIWIIWMLYCLVLIWFISFENFLLILLFSSLIWIMADFFSIPQKWLVIMFYMK